MNPFRKQHLKQWLARRCNIRYSHYHGYRFFWDPCCYPELKEVAAPLILDVGANVGQTAVGLRDCFPQAQLHCFEPVPSSFEVLKRNTLGMGVHCHRLAMSNVAGRVPVRLISTDPEFTMNSLNHAADGGWDSTADVVWFDVVTLPDFLKHQSLATVHLLKIDTEGRDLHILRGAMELLRSGCVWNVVLETVPTKRKDCDLIALDEFRHFLEPLGFELYSIFDIMHQHDGRVAFMNVLFKHRLAAQSEVWPDR
jgi:FkbM family methyltransferase